MFYNFKLNYSPTDVRSSQQKKIGIVAGHATLFTPKKTARAMSALSRALIEAGIKSLPPIEAVPVSVTLWLNYTAPKASLRGGWKTTKPDADNLAKSIIDCITKTGAVWADDSQVSELIVRKKYLADKNEKPFILLQIEYLKF